MKENHEKLVMIENLWVGPQQYKAEMLTTGPELMLYTVAAVCVNKNGGWAF
jgi:hypothetical protein